MPGQHISANSLKRKVGRTGRATHCFQTLKAILGKLRPEPMREPLPPVKQYAPPRAPLPDGGGRAASVEIRAGFATIALIASGVAKRLAQHCYGRAAAKTTSGGSGKSRVCACSNYTGNVVNGSWYEKLNALVTDRVSGFADGNPGLAPLSSRATSAHCCWVGVELRSGPVVVQEKEIPVPTYPKKYDGVTPGTPRH